MIDHNKFQNVIKNAFNRVSTFKNTPWYNETNVKSQKKVEIEDINVQQSPQIPSWEDNSSNFSNVDYSSSFPSSEIFSSLHTIEGDGNIFDDAKKSPGIYLDVSGSVALFVRLKLVALSDPDICSNSISYTAYPIDTSDNLLLENAYNFSYNSQLNFGGIEVFKPYNYTLEYYDSDFVTLEHSNGNWIFDNDTGIIAFEENPTNANSENIDLENVELYFTFVKYIGVQGLENLMYYKNGKIGIGNKDPQSELDISGSVNIIGDLDISNNLAINDDVVFIDNSYVGINTNTPQYELEVSGSVIIDGDLSINSGIGPGFFPIGAIIMWPTYQFPDGYGKWILCDGRNVSSTAYPDLSHVLGSTGGNISLPDFQDYYVKMPYTNGADDYFSISGDNESRVKLEERHVPEHNHTSNHSHDISDNGHTHETNPHSHDISDNGHTHETNPHTHDITDNGHNHKLDLHYHDISDNGHTHDFPIHSHNVTCGDHTHDYEHYTAEVSSDNNTSGGGNSGMAWDAINSNYSHGDVSGTDSKQVDYNVNDSTENSSSVIYDISLIANTTVTTTNATPTFDICSTVLDSSQTTNYNCQSIFDVSDSNPTSTSNVSSNIVVQYNNDTIDNNIQRSIDDNDELLLDISGLEHTTAFFFIRAK